jgi:hypothetical protein
MSAAAAAMLEHNDRQWKAEKRRRYEKARAAVDRYRQTQKERDRKAALRAIEDRCLAESSESRLVALLCLTVGAPPEISWPALINEWSHCDATWPDSNE